MESGNITYLEEYKKRIGHTSVEVNTQQIKQRSAIETRADFFNIISIITDLKNLITVEEKDIAEYYEWERGHLDK